MTRHKATVHGPGLLGHNRAFAGALGRCRHARRQRVLGQFLPIRSKCRQVLSAARRLWLLPARGTTRAPSRLIALAGGGSSLRRSCRRRRARRGLPFVGSRVGEEGVLLGYHDRLEDGRAQLGRHPQVTHRRRMLALTRRVPLHRRPAVSASSFLALPCPRPKFAGTCAVIFPVASLMRQPVLQVRRLVSSVRCCTSSDVTRVWPQLEHRCCKHTVLFMTRHGAAGCAETPQAYPCAPATSAFAFRADTPPQACILLASARAFARTCVQIHSSSRSNSRPPARAQRVHKHTHASRHRIDL